MIGLQKKTLFIHVPKTGGASLNKLFMNNLVDKQIENSLHKEMTGGKRLVQKKINLHATYRELSDRFKIFNKSIEDFFIFSCVRNPWDRALSAYKYFMYRILESPWTWKQKNISKSSFLGFKDYILYDNVATKGLTISVSKGGGLPVNFTGEYNWFNDILKKPQVHFLKNNFGKIDIDFIMRFENYENDYLKLCDLLNIKDKTIIHNNNTRPTKTKNSYKDFYDNDLKKFISKQYEEDIDTFKYTFD